jgi:hypothetical protein
MKHASTVRRGGIVARSALGLALALGLAGAGATFAPPAFAQKAPAAPKLKPSKAFQQVAVTLQKAMDTAKARGDVVQAKAALDAAYNAERTASGNAARQQARTQIAAARTALAGTLSNEKAVLEQVFAAIANEDDRFMAGNLALNYGGLAGDQATQRRGLEAMLQSGKVAPTDAARFKFFAGQIAFQMNDNASAIRLLQESVSAGYRENDAEALLAEAYIADNKVDQGLTVLMQAIDARAAAGTPAPVNWYRRGLGAAYKGQLLGKASDFAMALAKAYPTKENWGGAITVVREIGKFPAQETLDLMRLMDRTNSYAEERDYIEYIQAADARRLPGEVQKIVAAGLAAGKLRANDPFVSEARTISDQRVGPDRASLTALERDARAANASAATLMGAADAFLSYRENAKAEEFYKLALAKGSAEAPRLLTRLGIAQVDQGKFAEAQATLARVEGPRKGMAQLWSLYATQKAAAPQ